MPSILNLFKTDPFKMRRLAEKVDREMSHVSDDLLKHQIGFSRIELSASALAEAAREQSDSVAKSKKLRAAAEQALQMAEQAERASAEDEYRKRRLVDLIQTGIEAIERLQAEVDAHAATVQSVKDEAARAAADLARRPDDVASLRILSAQSESLAVLPHRLDAAKSAIVTLQREIETAQADLSKIK